MPRPTIEIYGERDRKTNATFRTVIETVAQISKERELYLKKIINPFAQQNRLSISIPPFGLMSEIVAFIQ